ncbi:hypothetical protein HDU97_000749 [Phlyctochytrium planicorne]|nr:hypothetical protein HDU97_000749 [Phlyctochytrium planicorne]
MASPASSSTSVSPSTSSDSSSPAKRLSAAKRRTEDAAMLLTPPLSVNGDDMGDDRHQQQPSDSDAPQAAKVPAFYNDANMDLLTFLVAEILECLTAHNDLIPLNPTAITRFHSRRAPSISILDYLRRIVRHAAVDRSCLLSVLVYMDRVCARPSIRFNLSSLTIHRFLIAAITISSKAHFDHFYSNRVYADIGGVPLKELNALEMELAFMLDWDMIASGERMQEYYVNMVRRHSNLSF